MNSYSIPRKQSITKHCVIPHGTSYILCDRNIRLRRRYIKIYTSMILTALICCCNCLQAYSRHDTSMCTSIALSHAFTCQLHRLTIVSGGLDSICLGVWGPCERAPRQSVATAHICLQKTKTRSLQSIHVFYHLHNKIRTRFVLLCWYYQ